MNTFEKVCPQCTGDAIATPDQGRNTVWCPQCGFKGTITEVSNINKEKSNQQKLKI